MSLTSKRLKAYEKEKDEIEILISNFAKEVAIIHGIDLQPLKYGSSTQRWEHTYDKYEYHTVSVSESSHYDRAHNLDLYRPGTLLIQVTFGCYWGDQYSTMVVSFPVDYFDDDHWRVRAYAYKDWIDERVMKKNKVEQEAERVRDEEEFKRLSEKLGK